MADGPIILDTCALLWLATGGGQLSEAALERIDAAAIVYISAISGFEIGLKYQSGKLTLPATPQQWFEVVTEHHGIDVLELDLSVCLLSTQLPTIHRDPCDRLIIATAQSKNLPIVTSDARIKSYDVSVVS
jgi:PIN domain nuclease of toxin-antitoxin system